ncbi:MAG: aldo/keto reductase [Betaproteobacteria bacterium]|nr:aldo/keto reductase [Betaproteobacteria bacterium]
MDTKALGASGLRITPLIFGGNVLGWTADEAKSFTLLDAFMAAGFQCIDTADVYSRWVPGHQGGESEVVLGRWLKARGNRAQVIVATKVGWDMGGDNKGLSTAYILRAVEDSLRRLQTDYIDLYQSHIDDAKTAPGEALTAYDKLIQQGKVRAIGASNFTGRRLREALQASADKGLPRYTCMQPHYNLCERADYETNLEPVCQEFGLGVIPYFSLAAGFLTGKYRSEADLSKSPRGGGLKKYLNPRGFRILGALDEVAAQTGTSPAAVALAWLLARPSVTAPIASATSLAQLDTLVAGARLKLDAAAVALLNDASAPA